MDVSERLALLSNDLRTLFSDNDPVYLRIHAVCADAKAEIERLLALCDERDEEIELLRAGLQKLAGKQFVRMSCDSKAAGVDSIKAD